MNDNWTNRKSNMKCRTCIWFAEKTRRETCDTESKPKIGRCRRHAPTMTGFPVVYLDDWCGDHKLNEEAEDPT